jgi:RNA polymerase sigma factor (sigma-70 family)
MVFSTSIEEEVARTEDIKKLKVCLKKLAEKEQEIITLKFSSEMNNREIARVMGLSESNVGTILCRAIKKLRDEFAGWQHE